VTTWEPLTAGAAARAAAFLWTVLLIVWIVFAVRRKRTKQMEHPAERLQHLVPVGVGFWLLFSKGHFWGWLDDFAVRPGLAAWSTGLALTAAGVAVSIWARISLGANWSGMVTLKQGHELVRNGLYRWIRHPIYTGLLLGMIGTALVLARVRGWLGFAIVLASFYAKARREERFLRQEFGPAFEEHQRSTGMFLPKLI